MQEDLHLDYTEKKVRDKSVVISGSKSESNRLLILKQWYPNMELENLSDSDDTRHLSAALSGDKAIVDIGHAGTAMRFLTAYFASQPGQEVILTGSQRMRERPIKILVAALEQLGASIDYEGKEGYPPLKIKGKQLTKNKVAILGNVSSQYISALLLIAPQLENGLEIELVGEITSRPYLEMTLSLLTQLGISYEWTDALIKIAPIKSIPAINMVVESDWSSASYYFSLVALSEIGTRIRLSSYRKESLQGDSCLVEIYKSFGVETTFSEGAIELQKTRDPLQERSNIELDLVDAPDIAQTIAVTCFGLKMACDLTGLHTLKIKETDRLVALQKELEKFGAKIEVTNDSLHLASRETIHTQVEVETYKDHRMAMAFAPLALLVPLTIKDAGVVTKSYISYWQHLEAIIQ